MVILLLELESLFEAVLPASDTVDTAAGAVGFERDREVVWEERAMLAWDCTKEFVMTGSGCERVSV